MSWYVVNLLFKSAHSISPEVPPLWEERFVLINAEDEEDAKLLGMQIGRKSEHKYVALNQKENKNDLVKWSFEQIERVYEIEQDILIHGSELFSRYLRDSEVKSLLTPFDDGP